MNDPEWTRPDSQIVETHTLAAQALEYRLKLIEQQINAGFAAQETRFKGIEVAIQQVDARVIAQNSRIGTLEKWRQGVEKAQAFARGVSSGARQLGGRQMAVAGILGSVLFALIQVAVHISWTDLFPR